MLNVKFRFFIFFFTFSLFQEAFSQSSLDILTVSGRYGFPQQAGEPVLDRNSEIGTLMNLKLPIVISKNTIWYSSLTYVYSYVQSDGDLEPNVANPIEINGFIVQSGLVQSLNEKQKLQLLFAPRYMTDFKNTTKDNWQFGGLALFENTYSDKLVMRFGFLFNQEMFGPSLTPLVYIDWKISSRWSVVGLAPIYVKLNYKVNENLTTGFSHFALLTTYRLGNPNYIDDYIERGSIDLTFFARQRMFNNVYAEARLGFAVDRYYEQYTKDQKLDLNVTLISFGDNRIPKNVLMKDGPIVNFRLVYNLPL
jgi:uncharacterized protein DUF6268